MAWQTKLIVLSNDSVQAKLDFFPACNPIELKNMKLKCVHTNQIETYTQYNAVICTDANIW